MRFITTLYIILSSFALYAQDDNFSISEFNEELRTVKVLHVDENGKTKTGTLICNKAIAQDLLEIFRELYQKKYVIHSIKPASEYDNDDERSMAANNTSCYNDRRTRNGGISKHAKGMAIDINPLWNPCIHLTDKNAGLIEPHNAKRTHIINKKDLAYRLFTAHGFFWGGNWKSMKDYQHFEKR